jgi:hypothetical protein
MFVEKYIIGPFKYAMSDWKKIFVGGVLGLIYILPSQLLNAILQTDNYIHSLESTTPDYSIVLTIFGAFGLIILASIIFGSLQFGYYMSIARNTVKFDDNQLPEWENWKELFKDGILYYIGSMLLALVIFIPFILLISIIGYGIYLAVGIPGLIIYIFLAIAIYMLLSLIYLFYLYLASINYANTDFMGFFEFKKILNLMSVKYIVLVIILFIINFIIAMLISIPSIVLNVVSVLSGDNIALLVISAVVNSILASFVGFFMMVFIFRSISIYYKEKTSEKTEKPDFNDNNSLNTSHTSPPDIFSDTTSNTALDDNIALDDNTTLVDKSNMDGVSNNLAEHEPTIEHENTD